MISSLASDLFCGFAATSTSIIYDDTALVSGASSIPIFKRNPSSKYPSIFEFGEDESIVNISNVRGLFSFAICFSIDWDADLADGASTYLVDVVFEIDNNGNLIERVLRLVPGQYKYNTIICSEKDVAPNTKNPVIIKCKLRSTNTNRIIINNLNGIFMTILSL